MMHQRSAASDSTNETVPFRTVKFRVVCEADETDAVLETVLDPINVVQILKLQAPLQAVLSATVQTRRDVSSHSLKVGVVSFLVHSTNI